MWYFSLGWSFAFFPFISLPSQIICVCKEKKSRSYLNRLSKSWKIDDCIDKFEFLWILFLKYLFQSFLAIYFIEQFKWVSAYTRALPTCQCIIRFYLSPLHSSLHTLTISSHTLQKFRVHNKIHQILRFSQVIIKFFWENKLILEGSHGKSIKWDHK